jgi:gamma-glutamyl:cysteine ligase YbdK (ATP-grasp superfamily)
LGQEISTFRFTAKDFKRYKTRLEQETELLCEWAAKCRLSDRGPVAGFELEAWLVDRNLNPAAVNVAFLEKMSEPLASQELALFNIELNNTPRLFTGHALRELREDVTYIWQRAWGVAKELGVHLMTIGILPTLNDTQLNLRYMSPLKRYRALNDQVLRARKGRPLRLNIVGNQHLHSEHSDVMLESATTSLQIHIQAPCQHAHEIYNAAIVASAPMVAACANSPYLFNHDLWDETRIPLFEQSVEIGGFDGASQGPVRRVSFGSGYARRSITECFIENLQHLPVLLPMLFDDEPPQLSHLRLHNGTIWRWNRPLIGFDADGTPHIRIEHRVLPGSPTIDDAIANAALFYGLCMGLCMEPDLLAEQLSFSQAKDNFYQAARYGLNAHATWFNNQKIKIRHLLSEELLPLAQTSLQRLGIERDESEHYLGIIKERLERKQNGCNWQRRFVARYGADMPALTAAYLARQQAGAPVHEWTL